MYKYKLKEIEVGDTEIRGGKKSTVTDIDPETGAITWDVADTADFSSTYKALKQAKDFLDTLEKTGESKDDAAIDQFAEEIANLFNAFRTHVRKNYPKEYERVSRLKESVNEQSEQWTQGDVNSVNKSLRLALKTFNNLVRNLEKLEGELSKHSNKPQGDILQSIAPNSFDYQGTQKKLLKLYNAFNNVFGNALKEDYNPDEEQERDEDEIFMPMDDEGRPLGEESTTSQDGASFTPGEGAQYATPFAFKKKGKKSPSIYYYKLGYKPVPKKIKGSGLEVKQLFEYSDFQEKRIAAFDEVEDRLNGLSSLLSNAKNETAEFYNENPGSYAIVYSTDYIFELLDEIENKLKKTED